MVAPRDNQRPREPLPLGDPAFWPEGLKSGYKPVVVRGPFNWQHRDFKPEVRHVPFNPDQETRKQVLQDACDYFLSLPTVAARYYTTPDALAEWLSRPENKPQIREGTWVLPQTVETLLWDFKESDQMLAKYRRGDSITTIASDWGLPAEDMGALFNHPRTQQRLLALRQHDDDQDIDFFKDCRRAAAKKLREVVEDSKDPIESRKAASVLFRYSNNALNPPKVAPGFGPVATSPTAPTSHPSPHPPPPPSPQSPGQGLAVARRSPEVEDPPCRALPGDDGSTESRCATGSPRPSKPSSQAASATPPAPPPDQPPATAPLPSERPGPITSVQPPRATAPQPLRSSPPSADSNSELSTLKSPVPPTPHPAHRPDSG